MLTEQEYKGGEIGATWRTWMKEFKNPDPPPRHDDDVLYHVCSVVFQSLGLPDWLCPQSFTSNFTSPFITYPPPLRMGDFDVASPRATADDLETLRPGLG